LKLIKGKWETARQRERERERERERCQGKRNAEHKQVLPKGIIQRNSDVNDIHTSPFLLTTLKKQTKDFHKSVSTQTVFQPRDS
jgi:hypothetical protein